MTFREKGCRRKKIALTRAGFVKFGKSELDLFFGQLQSARSGLL